MKKYHKSKFVVNTIAGIDWFVVINKVFSCILTTWIIATDSGRCFDVVGSEWKRSKYYREEWKECIIVEKKVKKLIQFRIDIYLSGCIS